MFLEIEKAFGRVWYKVVLYKLTAFEIPIAIFKIIESLFTTRIFQSKIEDRLSTTRQILEGTSQGSCFSPTLYLKYVNDMTTTPKAQLALLETRLDYTMFLT